MRSWGIFITIAMGFLLGLVLAGIGGISAGLKASVTDHKLKANQIDEFWNQSDIEKTDLTKLLKNDNCHSSEKYFLSCVNSLLAILQKTHSTLSSEGQVVAIQKAEQRLDNFSEKENLDIFLKIFKNSQYAQFNFDQLLEKILSQEKRMSKKYMYGLAINGFMSVYRDPHTYILPTKYFEEVVASSDRSPYFVGLSFERQNGQVLIRKVFKGSDADQAGLKMNDQVISINGQSVDSLNLSDLSQILKDKTFRGYTFIIGREQKQYIKTIQRSYRVLSQVSYELVPQTKNVGLIQISKFSKNTCEEVREALNSLGQLHMGGLILDLRDNPGGHLSEAACVGGLFLGANRKIYSIKYLDYTKDSEVALTTTEKIYSGPIVVLTNNSSASASEVIAGALQEYRRAIVLGERTFGKGTFQEVESWMGKKEISLFKTKGFYLLPSGTSTQFSGVIPDIDVEDRFSVTSEDQNYLNPIRPEIFNLRTKEHQSFLGKISLDHCGLNIPRMVSEDAFINHAQGVLTCTSVISNLASQFNPDEFN